MRLRPCGPRLPGSQGLRPHASVHLVTAGWGVRQPSKPFLPEPAPAFLRPSASSLSRSSQSGRSGRALPVPQHSGRPPREVRELIPVPRPDRHREAPPAQSPPSRGTKAARGAAKSPAGRTPRHEGLSRHHGNRLKAQGGHAFEEAGDEPARRASNIPALRRAQQRSLAAEPGESLPKTS